jgi:hypothetical protein
MVIDHVLAKVADVVAVPFLHGQFSELHFAVSTFECIADPMLVGIAGRLGESDGHGTKDSGAACS